MAKHIAAVTLVVLIAGCASLTLDDASRGQRDANTAIANGRLCIVIDRSYTPEPIASYIIEQRRILKAEYRIECEPLYLEHDDYIDTYRDTMSNAISERFGDDLMRKTYRDAVESVERRKSATDDKDADG